MTPAPARGPQADIDDSISAAWANVLAELLDKNDLTPETAAQANGGPVPATARTMRRWLNGEGGVSGEAIRDVCRALRYPALRGMTRARWLGEDEVSVLPPEPKARPHRLAEWVNDILTAASVPDALRELVEGVVADLKKFAERHYLGTAPVEPPGLKRRPGDIPGARR